MLIIVDKEHEIWKEISYNTFSYSRNKNVILSKEALERAWGPLKALE